MIEIFHNIKILHSTTKKILVIRFMRSIGQGALVVDFTLYLHALGYSGLFIGSLLTVTSLFGAILSIIIGSLSDKSRRKPFIVIYTILLILSSFALLVSSNTFIILIGSMLGSFGLGANGAAGPFAPTEQAWLAENIKEKKRGYTFSLNTASGFFGMGIGAIIAILPSFLHLYLKGSLSYRPLFLIIMIIAVLTLPIILNTDETHNMKSLTSKNDKVEKIIDKKENVTLLKLILTNSLNGIAIGLKGPLIAYWFAVHFHVGPLSIAPVIAITFFATSLLSFYTGTLTKYIGLIKSMVWERSLGIFFLILFPLIPIYPLAAVLYTLHQIFNRGSAGAKQALTVGLVRNKRRGFAISINSASMQGSRAVGPFITGYFLDINQFEIPFFIAAALQTVYLILYSKLFKEFDIK